MTQADLSNLDLSGAELTYSDLSEASLNGADLSGAVLSKATLRYAILSQADLRFAALCEADLTETDLSRANLFGADLREADLSGANLNGTHIGRAYIQGAFLKEGIGLSAQERRDLKERGAIFDNYLDRRANKTSEIYGHIHGFSPSASSARLASEPVTVKTASSRNYGFAIPTPVSGDLFSKKATSGFELNSATVQRKQDESARVSALLGDIFEQEEDLPKKVALQSLSSRSDTYSVAELDAIHTDFLKILAQRLVWNRSALDSKAAKLNLLLDGALEMLNDVAFERCDESLTDGDDPIELNIDVLKQLMP